MERIGYDLTGKVVAESYCSVQGRRVVLNRHSIEIWVTSPVASVRTPDLAVLPLTVEFNTSTGAQTVALCLPGEEGLAGTGACPGLRGRSVVAIVNDTAESVCGALGHHENAEGATSCFTFVREVGPPLGLGNEKVPK